jgi:hypothetical protein
VEIAFKLMPIDIKIEVILDTQKTSGTTGVIYVLDEELNQPVAYTWANPLTLQSDNPDPIPIFYIPINNFDDSYWQRVSSLLLNIYLSEKAFLRGTRYGEIFQSEWNTRTGLFFGERKEVVGAALYGMMINIIRIFKEDEFASLSEGDEEYKSPDCTSSLRLYNAIDHLLFAIHNKDPEKEDYHPHWLEEVEKDIASINSILMIIKPESPWYQIKLVWKAIYPYVCAFILQVGCMATAAAVGATVPLMVGAGCVGFAIGYAGSGFFRPRFSLEEETYEQTKQFVKEVEEAKASVIVTV